MSSIPTKCSRLEESTIVYSLPATLDVLLLAYAGEVRQPGQLRPASEVLGWFRSGAYVAEMKRRHSRDEAQAQL